MISRLAFRPSPALPRYLDADGLDADGQALEGRLYLEPCAFVEGPAAAAAMAAGHGWAVAGSERVFTAVTLYLRHDDCISVSTAPFSEMLAWSEAEGDRVAQHVGALLGRVGRRRPDFAGLALDRPRLMGIVNVTPDSFSDGGLHDSAEAAIAHGLALREQGADILDVGGESTRPGAAPVSLGEELARVVPVVRGLAERGALVSIDTRHAPVMQAAIAAGASIINDVNGLRGPGALQTAARLGVPVMVMHMQGEPGTMQQAPDYACAPLDVYDMLAERLRACAAAGIGGEKICLDPGIGFGKSVAHNVEILGRLALYHGLGCPLLLGASRKTFIAKLSQGEAPGDRLAGSLAAALAGLHHNVQFLRVHDVAETAQAVAIARAIVLPPSG